MHVLKSVKPSAEQLPIVLDDRAGIAVLRGAAGSGKTTTALLRLKQLCRARVARNQRLGLASPVRVLVLTYNRSLAGYVAALAKEQIADQSELDLTVSTFASWAQSCVGYVPIFDKGPRSALIRRLSGNFSLSGEFVESEVGYAFGRFEADDIDQYLERDRDGRGIQPRVDKPRFLTEILIPYRDRKRADSLVDWNDIAELVASEPSRKMDIIIVDEAQDFTANQVRAVLRHAAKDASITFVLDSVQRIYPNFFTWKEVGLDASSFVLNRRLAENRRNTKQIAAFARPLVQGLSVDENGQLPDLNSATEDGPLPIVFEGRFSEQARAIVDFLNNIDLAKDNVGILHPLGGGWFDTLRAHLNRASLDFVEITRNKAWPSGPVNIGLSSLHSAKGLEFDHVIMCGVTGETASASDDEDDTDTQNLRRLLAMAFGRAKVSLMLCHDPSKPTTVLRYLDDDTYVSRRA